MIEAKQRSRIKVREFYYQLIKDYEEKSFFQF